MTRITFLIALAAGALMSTGCSRTTTALASLPPPAACLTRCETPPAPPGPNDDKARRRWEIEVIDSHANCGTLHDDCAAEALRRMKAPK